MCQPVHQEEHLVPMYANQIDRLHAEVVKWCPDCGAIVIDGETDGRVNAGAVLKMMFPKDTFNLKELKMLQKGMNILGYYMTPTSEEEQLLAKLNGLVAEKEK